MCNQPPSGSAAIYKFNPKRHSQPTSQKSCAFPPETPRGRPTHHAKRSPRGKFTGDSPALPHRPRQRSGFESGLPPLPLVILQPVKSNTRLVTSTHQTPVHDPDLQLMPAMLSDQHSPKDSAGGCEPHHASRKFRYVATKTGSSTTDEHAVSIFASVLYD